MAEVLFIAGSPSRSSGTASILYALQSRVEASGHRTKFVRVRNLPATALLHGEFDHPDIVRVVADVSAAAVVVVGTPVYKASYAGVLKALLDLLPQNALAGKVVLPVATGGSLAHLLALEYALKPVLAALGTQTFLSAIYVQDKQILDTTAPRFEAEVEQRLESAVDAISAYLGKAAPPRLISPPAVPAGSDAEAALQAGHGVNPQ
ncbi:MAG: NADPH-dependent FMN reductase [bacterium]|nr:NADPH-dependent FMN reductase [bacterium]